MKELLERTPEEGILKIIEESKIGFDGSTGHSIYNQAFSLENKDASDASLLSTCLVPLQYRTEAGEVIWVNPVPQAATFCQPVRLEFQKETPEASREIDSWIDKEVQDMPPHIIEVSLPNSDSKKYLEVHHIVKKTMLDGKAKNACTETSSAQKCFLCNANPSDFNKLSSLTSSFPTIEKNLQYGGICDLHAWLRAFDAINSLSDKLTIKKWRAKKSKSQDVPDKVAEVEKQKAKKSKSQEVPVPEVTDEAAEVEK